MVNWKRPENVPFPSIWRTFERKAVDGTIRKFWVQDLTPEYEGAFLNMGIAFLKDEPTSKYSKFMEDSESVQNFIDTWKVAIKVKLGVICLTQDENGTKLVGGNMTTVCEKDEDFSLEGKGKLFQKVESAILYVSQKVNIFSEFNVDEYLTANGLYVFPNFRGLGIGAEILKARRELCLAVGLKVSATVFTSLFSQKNAQQAGFEELVEVDYRYLEKINPEWNFPGITSDTKSIKYMCIKYE